MSSVYYYLYSIVEEKGVNSVLDGDGRLEQTEIPQLVRSRRQIASAAVKKILFTLGIVAEDHYLGGWAKCV
jgi:hypothetical protein